MDYRINREALASNEIVFDGCQEQPVDLDFSLPDYCPDIQRILKCQVYPRITMRTIAGDRLEVEGMYTVRILYVDSGGKTIRSCEHTDPFSSSFNLRPGLDGAIVTTKTRVEYINCRAISPRRLDIHGSFSVCAKVLSKVSNEILSDIAGEGIQLQKKPVEVSTVAEAAQQQFSINEVLEIGQGKPEAESIVRSDVALSLQDYKAVANKIMLKGEALVKVLYCSDLDDGKLEAMEYAVPFSQMLDSSEISEDCKCDIHLEVLSSDVQIRSDNSGEDTLFGLEIKVAASVTAYQDKELNIVTDAYSTGYELTIDYQQVAAEKMVEMVNDDYAYKNTMDLSDDAIANVIDIWNEMAAVSARAENGQINYKGKINACILAENTEGTPVYFERIIDFDYMHDWSGKPNDVRCVPDIGVTSMSYRITGSGGIEMRAQIKLSAAVFAPQNFKCIADVAADETKPKVKDKSAALTIYYADAGENLWDIARRYCTSVDAIKLENDLVSDTLENRGMLLIPM